MFRSSSNIIVNKLLGSLLIAHPSLKDPLFSKSLVLLASHQEEDDGVLGLILNRPVGKCIGDIAPNFSEPLLLDVPIYQGGPVQTDRLFLTACRYGASLNEFQFYFGLNAYQAIKLMLESPELQIKAYVGYAGWSGPQIIREIYHKEWVISQPTSAILHSPKISDWKAIISRAKPEFKFLAEFPEDPSLN